MFGIGETELVIILLFGFMVFGPDKLPGMGRTIGRALRQFREAQQGFTQVVQTEVLDPAAEAMNATPTRRTRNRAAELEADSDLEGTEDGAAPRVKETFAERRARLEAERKAAQEAEAAAQLAAAEEIAGEDDTIDSDADAPEADIAPAAAPAPEAAPEPVDAPEASEALEAPAKDPLASLYDISGKTTKSARKQASEEKAAQVAERKAAAEAAALAKAAEAEAAEAEVAKAEVAEAEVKTTAEADADAASAAASQNTDDTGKEDGTAEA